MNPYVLLAALFISPPGLAQGSPALIQRPKIFRELKATIESSFHTLPPCDAHRAIAEATARFEPPASCPRSLEMFRKTQEMQNGFTGLCEDLSRHLDSLLDEPEACAKGPDGWPEALREREAELREKHEAVGAIIDTVPINDEDWLDFEEGKGKGEFAREECALSFTLALQLRKTQSNRFNTQRSRGLEALETCEPDAPERLTYEEYQRQGEAALPSR